ncbi:MAG: geranylgeranylglycerol-phosphate geranylgeranyltransferase [Bacteroidia bacterium]|nr:geranylgeranylglycerol-phosphate geranylgeranyltransferase [Bacteroidia bacterium]
MFNVKFYFRLIRPANLLMLLFTIYMVRFAFIRPLFELNGLCLQIPESTFTAFSLAFILIAAGGYVINDYCDIQIDSLNKPDRVVIGRQVTAKSALALYLVLTILGLLAGFAFSLLTSLPWTVFMFSMYAAGLWLYSRALKRMVLIGNLAIALFIGFLPFASGMAEYSAAMNRYCIFLVTSSLFSGISILYGISLFAFLSTLAREIIKDAEDLRGDREAGRRTIPAVLGIKATKGIVVALMLIILLFFAGVELHFSGTGSFLFFIFATIFEIMVVALSIKVIRAASKQDYHDISSWQKGLMLFGICFLFLFNHILKETGIRLH